MLGIQKFPNHAKQGRGSLALLAIAASAAAFFAVAGTAQAQECVGGYRMVKGEIPVVCSEPAGSFALASGGTVVNEPVYTGSINRELPPNAARVDQSATAAPAAGGSCVGGFSYRETAANGYTLPMRC